MKMAVKRLGSPESTKAVREKAKEPVMAGKIPPSSR